MSGKNLVREDIFQTRNNSGRKKIQTNFFWTSVHPRNDSSYLQAVAFSCRGLFMNSPLESVKDSILQFYSIKLWMVFVLCQNKMFDVLQPTKHNIYIIQLTDHFILSAYTIHTHRVTAWQNGSMAA